MAAFLLGVTAGLEQPAGHGVVRINKGDRGDCDGGSDHRCNQRHNDGDGEDFEHFDVSRLEVREIATLCGDVWRLEAGGRIYAASPDKNARRMRALAASWHNESITTP